MLILSKSQQISDWLTLNKSNNQSVGFVPTMGALHLGHLSLVEKSISENDFTIISIFVNPTQFNNPEDFKKYPNTLENDIKLLEKTSCDILYTPDLEDIYPNKIFQKNHYDFSNIDKVMEGEFRPGHFDGVATVVKKLFENVKPNRAYFGEKDYQQLLIVKEMVKIEKIPVEIIGMPTLREKDGLAMSSRNLRLTESQRNEAPLIYKALQKAKNLAQSNVNIQEIKDIVSDMFANSNLKLEYFEIRENNSLKFAFELKENKKYHAFISVYAGEIRLIDNIELL